MQSILTDIASINIERVFYWYNYELLCLKLKKIRMTFIFLLSPATAILVFDLYAPSL